METFNLKDLNPEDLQLYFHGTFVKLNPDKMWPEDREVCKSHKLLKSRWIKVEAFGHFEDEGNKLFMTNSTGRDMRVVNDLFSLDFPETGFYNWKATALYYQRKTKRQNKKGLCGDTCIITNIADGLKTSEGFAAETARFWKTQTFKWTPECISSMFDSDLSSLENAFRDIWRFNTIARTISRELALTVGFQDKFPSIWLGLTYVGRMLTPNVVQIDVPMLAQEVKDAFKGFSVEIKE